MGNLVARQGNRPVLTESLSDSLHSFPAVREMNGTIIIIVLLGLQFFSDRLSSARVWYIYLKKWNIIKVGQAIGVVGSRS